MPRFILIASLAAASAAAQIQTGFEDAQLGQRPPEWFTSKGHLAKPYVWETTTDCLDRKGQCVQVRWTGDQPSTRDSWTNLMRTVDATPYRGKRVRLRCLVATGVAHPLSRGLLWMRADLATGGVGFFDNMDDRPVVKPAWAPYEIVGDIEADAKELAFGFMHHASGWSRFDDFSIEILGDTPVQVDPPKALTEAGRRNLRALAKLYGYVRYFYPSAETAATDWEQFLVDAVPAVEPATSAQDLVASLKKLFAPIAPEVEIGAAGAAQTVKAERMIVWRHDGLGLTGGNPATNIYRSRLDVKAAPEGVLPTPYEAEIAPGLRVRVPLALLAPEVTPALKLAPSRARTYKTGVNRAARLAAVMISWNVFQHFYPYFDVARADWNAMLGTTLDAVAAKEGDRETSRTLRRMVAALEDGHGAVSGAEPSRRNVPLALARVEGRIVVVHVADAQDQKISAGDVIVKVNGRPVDELYAEEAALISGATEQWIRDRALRSLLAGPVSEPLVLEIEPFAAEPGSRREVTFKRGSSPTAPKEPRPRTKEMEPGVWYVNLDGIQASDWNEVLPKLAEAKGIVLDMRGYPGMGPEFLQHMSKEPLKSAQWHTPMVLAPDRTSVEWNRRGEWNLPPKAPYLAAPRVFLLDGGAISYAESVMGIVEAYKLGAIVGEASAGTNGNINPFVTPGGYNFWWTGMKVIKHDGTRHHGVGIQPTVPVARTRAGVAAGRDEYLEKALEILKSL